jgi:LPS sulfotransferase NodH
MRFIIFANARSGSTSLAKTLASSPDVNLSMETFHPKYSEWNPDERDYSKTIKSEEDMKEALKEILKKYNAMKVLKYQFPKEIYSAMLLEEGIKIINLSRRNAFDAALSSLIAQQTNVWQKEDEGEDKELKEIPIYKIQEIVEHYDEDNRYYAELLDENKKGEHIDLVYEDIFSEDNEENIKLIQDITIFLEIRMPTKDVIAKYMIPSSASIESKKRYKDIPNWEEIEEEFKDYILD